MSRDRLQKVRLIDVTCPSVMDQLSSKDSLAIWSVSQSEVVREGGGAFTIGEGWTQKRTTKILASLNILRSNAKQVLKIPLFFSNNRNCTFKTGSLGL